MIERRKEVLDIRFYDPRASLDEAFLHLMNGLKGGASRTESVAGIGKRGFEIRLQDKAEGLLHLSFERF